MSVLEFLLLRVFPSLAFAYIISAIYHFVVFCLILTHQHSLGKYLSARRNRCVRLCVENGLDYPESYKDAPNANESIPGFGYETYRDHNGKIVDWVKKEEVSMERFMDYPANYLRDHTSYLAWMYFTPLKECFYRGREIVAVGWISNHRVLSCVLDRIRGNH